MRAKSLPLHLLVLGALGWVCAGDAAGQSSEPWKAAGFSAPAGELLRAATAATQGETADVVVLYETARHSLDAQGRDTQTWRIVYRVLTARGVDAWSTTQVRWQPWHEERPEFRARVITPDGAEHWLDPKTIGEFPVYEQQPATFNDARVLRGPLPAVAPGAVVESEIVLRDRTTFFEAGVVRYFSFGAGVPTLATRLVLEAPAQLPLKHVTRLLPAVKLQREEHGGQVRWIFEAGRLEALAGTDPLVAPELAQSPYVAFSTGKSWAEVAEAYARIVDAQVAAADGVKDMAAQATRGARTRDEKIARLLERMRREVRYTAVEFGDAAVVPRSPTETLQRRYGDCKDQATLLVALLRAAGLEAHLALLNTDSGTDVERELPGLGGFNHAIVYIPGKPPVWVDTTHDFARPNQLPTDDQGRQALLAAPGTKALTVTPTAEPADNLIVETREFFLSDEGPARVVETSVTHGAAELWYRANYATATREQVQEWIKNYAANAYLAEDVAHIEFTDPADLSQPFRLRFEAKGAKRGWTDIGDAGAAILPSGLLERLPESWRTAPEEEKPPAETGQPEWVGLLAAADRVLPEPFVTEWNYRIHPPAGFRPGELPVSETQALGPVTLTRTFEPSQDGVVTAKLRLDTGKRRFRPEEIAKLRQEADKLAKTGAILVRFENVGEAHLQAGRIREALAEFRRLRELHPDEALHRTQVARALLEAGLGEAARREVRATIERHPESALAHRTLGWILQHDLIGRRFGKGFDHVGAVAAYRRALELKPDDRIGRIDLAILLEHNSTGLRYGTGARLDEAIAEYQKLDEVEPTSPLFNNLPIAMFRARRFDDLKEFLKSHRSPAHLNYLYLAAVAAGQGTAAAQREATTLLPGPEARREAFLTAGQQLISLRHYSEAADLLTAGAPSAPNPTEILQRAALMRRVRRFEDIPLPADDPQSVWPRFLQGMIQGTPASEMMAYLARVIREGTPEKSLKELDGIAAQVRQTSTRLGLTPEVMLDLALSLTQVSVDGEGATCCRLRYRGDLPTMANQVVFIGKEDGAYRIFGLGSSLGAVGKRVLEMAGAGELAAARRWLDWVREGRPPGGGEDRLGGPILAHLWTRGEAAGLERVGMAAAVLMAEDKETAGEAVPLLLEARERSGSEPERVQLDRALALAHTQLERHDQAVEVLQRLLAAEPKSESAFMLLVGHLMQAKRWAEAEEAARARLALVPDDVTALRMQMHLAQQREDYAAARALHQRVVDQGKAEASDYNEIAWQALFESAVGEEALEAGARAARMTENKNPAILHTLACLFAETGQTTEARQVALHAMDMANLEEPSPIFWFIFARIAEQFGENEAAAEAYRKAMADEPGAEPFMATSELARRRLAKLEAGGGEKATVAAPKTR
jgi:tetratricopeptide (TPR) repeat protein